MLDYDFICLDESWLDQMSSLEQSAQIIPWSFESIRTSLSHGAFACGVVNRADIDPKIKNVRSYLLGFILVGSVLGEAEILTFSIDPNFQRQGLGNFLLSATIDFLKLEGIQSIFLEVRQSNVAAITLYQQFEFEIIGRRKNYYRLNQSTDKTEQTKGLYQFEDALIMKRAWRS